MWHRAAYREGAVNHMLQVWAIKSSLKHVLVMCKSYHVAREGMSLKKFNTKEGVGLVGAFQRAKSSNTFGWGG